MRWHDVHIEACAVALGELVPVEQAVADGRYRPEFCRAHKYRSISDSGEATAVELAARATSLALSRSAFNADDVELLLYAWCGAPTPGIVTPASWVQSNSVPTTLSAVEVRQGCNSGVAALEMAACYLRAMDDQRVVAVLSADKVGASRYRDDLGSVGGDGAAALMLSRSRGFATLLSTVVIGDGRLEGLPLVRPPAGSDRRQFLAEQRRNLLPILRARLELQKEAVRRALSEADLPSSAIDRWVFPNIGEVGVNRDLMDAVGAKDDDTHWEWGRTVGHLDAGDQTTGLANLIESAALRPGQHVALVGSSVGVSYGCAVVRIDATPPWSQTPI